LHARRRAGQRAEISAFRQHRSKPLMVVGADIDEISPKNYQKNGVHRIDIMFTCGGIGSDWSQLMIVKYIFHFPPCPVAVCARRLLAVPDACLAGPWESCMQVSQPSLGCHEVRAQFLRGRAPALYRAARLRHPRAGWRSKGANNQSTARCTGRRTCSLLAYAGWGSVSLGEGEGGSCP
jgi:hypothetical protein